MKIFSLLFLFSALSVYCQDESELDKGFHKIAINAPLSVVKGFLTACEPSGLWHSDAADIGSIITSGWLVDLKKAGIADYHGLKIMRIEVYIDSGFEEEGAALVHSFKIYLEKPANDVSGDFVSSHFDLYGGASYLLHPETEDPVGFTWWTETTMLNLSLGYDFETETSFDYYLAEWQRAYG